MSTLSKLITNIDKIASEGKTDTGIPGLAAVKGTIPEHKLSGLYEPMINLVIQGSKRLNIGEKVFNYSPATYFVMSVDLPATGEVFSDDKTGAPYMAIALTINSALVAEILEAVDFSALKSANAGFGVGEMSEQLMDAWGRLVDLINSSGDTGYLAQLYEKELLYLTLLGSQGAVLRDIAQHGSVLKQIHKAIEWIRANYKIPVAISQLADLTGMSEASFFRKFKAITALSPIQYQKQMRLLEARRLLIETDMNAGSVCFEVGYESHSQFTREYTRFFSRPPLKDAKCIKELFC